MISNAYGSNISMCDSRVLVRLLAVDRSNGGHTG
jgi:hypothetical protein